ncbi:hypothetical protein KR093_002498 [Drosophila rubida]|uniref:Uncharacterized protein n=1 Tax=Drosophila rubida TaxID=30044 RepID=A0AAD4K9K7_9MUSC|nr:hypothetical protein KR093_002498 [Drosophila rubida]
MADSLIQQRSKLRIALITEDALQRLQPQQKEVSPMEIKDIYETIDVTVNAILEHKLRVLKLDNLDELIEKKIIDIQEKQNKAKLMALKTSSSINTLSDFHCVGIRSNNRSPYSNCSKQKKIQKAVISKSGCNFIKKQPINNRKVTTTNHKTTMKNNKEACNKRRLVKTVK